MALLRMTSDQERIERTSAASRSGQIVRISTTLFPTKVGGKEIGVLRSRRSVEPKTKQELPSRKSPATKRSSCAQVARSVRVSNSRPNSSYSSVYGKESRLNFEKYRRRRNPYFPGKLLRLPLKVFVPG